MNNRLLLIVCIVGILVFGAIMLINTSQDSTTTTPDQTVKSVDENDPTGSQSSVALPAVKADQTLAKHWKWLSRSKAGTKLAIEEGQDQRLPFTEQSVFDALQAVKVDENGDVVLDHDALVSLDETLERIYNRLDADSTLKLQDLIKTALPEKTGEQTAKLVGDYNNFLQAKEQFDQIHSAAPIGPQTVATIESDQLLYKQLQTLREVHLGQDTAQNLFHVSDANAEYMFESLKLGLDNTLSAEQIAARRAQIDAQHQEQIGQTDNAL